MDFEKCVPGGGQILLFERTLLSGSREITPLLYNK